MSTIKMTTKSIALLLVLFVAASARIVTVNSRKLMGGMKMMMHHGKMTHHGKKATKKSDLEVECQLNFSVEDAEDLCTLFEVFDNNGRFENNDKSIPGFEWPDLCDDFRPFNDWLCPSVTAVQEGICSHRRPWLNPAVREHYCGPLLESLPPGPRRESCETWCTNYVSKDRGDCCDMECDSMYP